MERNLRTFEDEDFSDAWDPSRLRGIAPLSGYWLVERWSPELLPDAMRLLCQVNSPGPDWETVASRIGSTLQWDRG